MSTDSPRKKVYLQKARLMELLQALKNGNAKIEINLDIYGREKVTTYGEGEDCDHSLNDLLKVVWTDDRKDGLFASNGTIYDYFKDFEIDKRSRAYSFLPPKGDVDPAIKNIKAQFLNSPDIENRERKQEMFFGGLLPKATNVLVAFPELRQRIIQRLDKFISYLQASEDGFPYRQLREQTELRSYRYKSIEKQIFLHIKQADTQTINSIRDNMLALMTAQRNHLSSQENDGVGMEEPRDEKILTNKLTFRELSDPEAISITEEDIDKLNSIGFQDAFQDENSWFDSLRLKKLEHWKETLLQLHISAWPTYYLEHYLVAYIEFNSVCEEFLQIRREIFHEIGFDVTFSEDGTIPKWTQMIDSLGELAALLSNYIYESNAFVRKVRADGLMLQKPLFALGLPLRDNHNKPDKTFYSRIERLLWKYILIHLCECCEMNKEWIEKHHDPISKL